MGWLGGVVLVVFGLSSDSRRRWSSDATTDDYTDDKPLPPPAAKATPRVPSLPRAAPGCVLGRGGPGWAGVGRGGRWGVVVDSVRTVRRFVVVGGGFRSGWVSKLKRRTTFERLKLF